MTTWQIKTISDALHEFLKAVRYRTRSEWSSTPTGRPSYRRLGRRETMQVIRLVSILLHMMQRMRRYSSLRRLPNSQTASINGLEMSSLRLTYTVIYEKGPTSWGAYVPDLPGVISVGDSREEVEQLITEAIQFHLEGMREEGIEILLRRASRGPSRSSGRAKRPTVVRSITVAARKALSRPGRYPLYCIDLGHQYAHTPPRLG